MQLSSTPTGYWSAGVAGLLMSVVAVNSQVLRAHAEGALNTIRVSQIFAMFVSCTFCVIKIFVNELQTRFAHDGVFDLSTACHQRTEKIRQMSRIEVAAIR